MIWVRENSRSARWICGDIRARHASNEAARIESINVVVANAGRFEIGPGATGSRKNCGPAQATLVKTKVAHVNIAVVIVVARTVRPARPIHARRVIAAR